MDGGCARASFTTSEDTAERARSRAVRRPRARPSCEVHATRSIRGFGRLVRGACRSRRPEHAGRFSARREPSVSAMPMSTPPSLRPRRTRSIPNGRETRGSDRAPNDSTRPRSRTRCTRTASRSRSERRSERQRTRGIGSDALESCADADRMRRCRRRCARVCRGRRCRASGLRDDRRPSSTDNFEAERHRQREASQPRT